MDIQYKKLVFAIVLGSYLGVVNAGNNPFEALNNPLEGLFGVSQEPQQEAQGQEQAAAAAQNRNVRYAGYSEKFQSVKQLMQEGRASEALDMYVRQYNDGSSSIGEEEESASQDNSGGFGSLLSSFTSGGTNTSSEADNASDKEDKGQSLDINTAANESSITKKQSANTSFLGSVEKGVLAIDSGGNDIAVEHFAIAEEFIEENKKTSKTVDTLSDAGSFLGSILSGDGEVGAYKGEGFERVLMLNYKSVAYMLNGDRRAYNVTRRSIEWQNIEKKKFEERLRAARTELDNKINEQDQKGNNVDGLNLGDTVSDQHKETEEKALSVPSAYVNPFGYYMAGIVQEFDSYEDRSLRGNALIAYKKALKLNPSSKVIKRAVKDLKMKRAPKNKRLVHIVLGDGLTPEKKMLRYDISAIKYNIPVKLPIYEPVHSKVARIDVQSSSGKKMSTFSTVADVEAITLRHQKDSEPFQHLLVTATVIRSIFEKEALEQMGGLGTFIGGVRDEMGNPDMRSWMTLPSTLQAVRMYLPEKQRIIQLVSFDADGNELSRRKIELNTSSHNFVYARTLDDTMLIRSSKELWVAMK